MNADQQLILDANVTEFFQGLVEEAVSRQNVDVSEDAICYIVNLLSSFTDSEVLFEYTPDGWTIRPLALLYAEAMDAGQSETRNLTLKRLGDVALFISGLYSDSLARKVVDVDYYIAMGCNAYGYLSSSTRNNIRWRPLREVFDELSSKFPFFVDVLNGVSDQTNFRNDSDVMRLYEVWQRTGSRHAENKLRQQGIHPIRGADTSIRH